MDEGNGVVKRDFISRDKNKVTFPSVLSENKEIRT